jgi:hypothetical protein
LFSSQRGRRKVRPSAEQAVQQVEPGQVGRNGFGPRRGRGFFQGGERGAVLAFGHVHQVLDGVAQPPGQAGGDALKQILDGVGRDRGDQALQRARGRQHDAGGAEKLFGKRHSAP